MNLTRSKLLGDAKQEYHTVTKPITDKTYLRAVGSLRLGFCPIAKVRAQAGFLPYRRDSNAVAQPGLTPHSQRRFSQSSGTV